MILRRLYYYSQHFKICYALRYIIYEGFYRLSSGLQYIALVSFVATASEFKIYHLNFPTLMSIDHGRPQKCLKMGFL